MTHNLEVLISAIKFTLYYFLNICYNITSDKKGIRQQAYPFFHFVEKCAI